MGAGARRRLGEIVVGRVEVDSSGAAGGGGGEVEFVRDVEPDPGTSCSCTANGDLRLL